jgi:hypothetical protein
MAEHRLHQEPAVVSRRPANIDPDRRVDQDHAACAAARRRGMGRTARSEPPKAASRLALAGDERLSPALTTAVFSQATQLRPRPSRASSINVAAGWSPPPLDIRAGEPHIQAC